MYRENEGKLFTTELNLLFPLSVIQVIICNCVKPNEAIKRAENVERFFS